MELIRLSSQTDVAEIAGFLNRVWGTMYGPTGCPVFNEAYLSWLYGGPDMDRTFVVGVRVSGKIVGLKAFLFREMLTGGVALRGSLNTHVAIDPALALRERVELARKLGDLHLVANNDLFSPPPFDLEYTVFEEQKRLIQATQSVMTRQGLERVTATFQTMIVSPGRVRNAMAAVAPGTSVRPGSVPDCPRISGLCGEVFSRANEVPLVVRFTPERIRHHWFNAPRAEVWVAEEGDAMTGAVGVYALDTIKEGATKTVAVIEGLVARSQAAAAHLLQAAVEYSSRVNARGVVIENATYLDAEIMRTCGLIPSGRIMRLAVMTKQPLDIGTRWFLDMK